MRFEMFGYTAEFVCEGGLKGVRLLGGLREGGGAMMTSMCLR